MHNQIERLKEGNERACNNCGKIYEAIYFPYKSVNHCINCYENEHGVILHKHRKRINRKNTLKKISRVKRFETAYRVCPTCQAETLTVDKGGDEICKNCNKTAKSYKGLKIKIKKDHFQRENTLDEIITHIKQQKANNMPLKFWYRNDIKYREVYDYYIDGKYVNVHSNKGYFIKFLIDKIRKIKKLE